MGKIFLRPQVRPRLGVGRILLLLALAASLSTCGPGHGTDCLTSTGPVTTERREMPAGLRSVSTYDNVDLILVQDATGAPYAEVRAGKNLLPDVQTSIVGDQLNISNTARCNWARSYDTPREVTLHVPSMTNVFLRGSGNISTSGPFQQDSIFFHLAGAGDFNLDVRSTYLWVDLYELGDVNLRGQTKDMLLTLGGNGRFFGADMLTRNCYFKTNLDSNGDAHVTATDLLTGPVRGNGTFYYSGNPRNTDIELTGHGQAKRVP
jgi:hypothetical protein